MRHKLSKAERINQFGSSFADAVSSENYSNIFALRAYMDESGAACVDELHPCPLSEHRELPEGEWWVPAVFNGRILIPKMVAPQWMTEKQQNDLLANWKNEEPLEFYNKYYAIDGREYFEQCLREVDEILSDMPCHGDLAADIAARDILDQSLNGEREKFVQLESKLQGAPDGVSIYSEMTPLEHYRGQLIEILSLPIDDDGVWKALKKAYFAGEFRSILSRADSLAEAFSKSRPFRVKQDKSDGGEPLCEWQEYALRLLQGVSKIRNKEVMDELEKAGKARFVKQTDGFKQDGYVMSGGTGTPLGIDVGFKKAMTNLRAIAKKGTSP